VTTLPSAPSAPVTTMTFPSMMGLRAPGKGAHTIVRRFSFAMRRISHPDAGITWKKSCRVWSIEGWLTLLRATSPDDLINFAQAVAAERTT
jgi:hypothetical protein